MNPVEAIQQNSRQIAIKIRIGGQLQPFYIDFTPDPKNTLPLIQKSNAIRSANSHVYQLFVQEELGARTKCR